MADKPSGYLPPNDPHFEACKQQGGLHCNPDPSVYATFVAGNPLAQPPSATPHYISEAQAIAAARGSHTNADARARLMTRAELEALAPALGVNNMPDPRRKIWVVTVDGDVWTRGDAAHKPHIVHVYTVVLDAETGQWTDSGLGLEVLR